METITINDVEYVKKSDLHHCGNAENWKHVCVIATNGWIFKGYQDVTSDNKNIGLSDAYVVRSWSNGLGIGGLADPDHRHEYTMDKIGCIEIFADAIIAVIELRWE